MYKVERKLNLYGAVSESADDTDSKSVAFSVWVQVPPALPL